MSPLAQTLSAQTLAGDRLTLEKYRHLKAQALMRALASQCRTPMDAVRFVFVQLQSTRPVQRVAEASLRARRL